MRNPPLVPTCEGCSRTEKEVVGLLSMRKGGFPVWICFDCVEALSRRVRAERAATDPHL